MHLLEAYLPMERSAPGRGYLQDADALVSLFEARLLGADRRVLLEYFTEDWFPHPTRRRGGSSSRGIISNGSGYSASTPPYREGTSMPSGEGLYREAREHGIGSDGLVYDEVATDMSVIKGSHRVWPHTEAIKAAAAQRTDGDASAKSFAGSMARGLLDHFLDRPFIGGWADHVDAAHRPLVDYVPASSLYHLFFAAAEAAKGFATTETASPR
jgi:mannose-6-phosphate isomerase